MGQIIVQYIDGIGIYTVIESIHEHILSDITDDMNLYNIYLQGGYRIIANGIVLGEPSKQTMKQWYRDMSVDTSSEGVTYGDKDIIVTPGSNVCVGVFST